MCNMSAWDQAKEYPVPCRIRFPPPLRRVTKCNSVCNVCKRLRGGTQKTAETPRQRETSIALFRQPWRLHPERQRNDIKDGALATPFSARREIVLAGLEDLLTVTVSARTGGEGLGKRARHAVPLGFLSHWVYLYPHVRPRVRALWRWIKSVVPTGR